MQSSMTSSVKRKWNRQLTRPIFPAGAKNAVWKRDYPTGGVRLSVEMPWLVLGGPIILALFAQIGLENTALTL